MGLASLPTGNGNPFMSSARTSAYTHRAALDTLTQLGSNLRIEPGLATSWEAAGDYTWIVTLRDGVRFSNGEPFNADAVVSTYAYLSSQAGARESLSRDMRDIAGFEALGPLTVRFTTRKPLPEFPRDMTVIWMVPPLYWREVGRDGFALHPVGTGPFQVTEWNPTQVKYDAHRESWRSPEIDKLEILVLREMAARVAALMTNRVDVASEIGPEDVYTIEAAGYRAYQRPPTAPQVIAFNILKESPLQDVRVRRALNYAVNKEVIAVTIMDGPGRHRRSDDGGPQSRTASGSGPLPVRSRQGTGPIGGSRLPGGVFLHLRVQFRHRRQSHAVHVSSASPPTWRKSVWTWKCAR